MSNHLDLSQFKSCSCGLTVEDPDCIVKSEYTSFGWFLWSMGTTAIPKKISFTCPNCNLNFETLTDKKIIKYYTYYRRN